MLILLNIAREFECVLQCGLYGATRSPSAQARDFCEAGLLAMSVNFSDPVRMLYRSELPFGDLADEMQDVGYAMFGFITDIQYLIGAVKAYSSNCLQCFGNVLYMNITTQWRQVAELNIRRSGQHLLQDVRYKMFVGFSCSNGIE